MNSRLAGESSLGASLDLILSATALMTPGHIFSISKVSAFSIVAMGSCRASSTVSGPQLYSSMMACPAPSASTRAGPPVIKGDRTDMTFNIIGALCRGLAPSSVYKLTLTFCTEKGSNFTSLASWACPLTHWFPPGQYITCLAGQ